MFWEVRLLSADFWRVVCRLNFELSDDDVLLLFKEERICSL